MQSKRISTFHLKVQAEKFHFFAKYKRKVGRNQNKNNQSIAGKLIKFKQFFR